MTTDDGTLTHIANPLTHPQYVVPSVVQMDRPKTITILPNGGHQQISRISPQIHTISNGHAALVHPTKQVLSADVKPAVVHHRRPINPKAPPQPHNVNILVCPAPCSGRCAGNCPQECCHAQAQAQNGDQSVVVCQRPCINNCTSSCPPACCSLTQAQVTAAEKSASHTFNYYSNAPPSYPHSAPPQPQSASAPCQGNSPCSYDQNAPGHLAANDGVVVSQGQFVIHSNGQVTGSKKQIGASRGTRLKIQIVSPHSYLKKKIKAESTAAKKNVLSHVNSNQKKQSEVRPVADDKLIEKLRANIPLPSKRSNVHNRRKGKLKVKGRKNISREHKSRKTVALERRKHTKNALNPKGKKRFRRSCECQTVCKKSGISSPTENGCETKCTGCPSSYERYRKDEMFRKGNKSDDSEDSLVDTAIDDGDEEELVDYANGDDDVDEKGTKKSAMSKVGAGKKGNASKERKNQVKKLDKVVTGMKKGVILKHEAVDDAKETASDEEEEIEDVPENEVEGEALVKDEEDDVELMEEERKNETAKKRKNEIDSAGSGKSSRKHTTVTTEDEFGNQDIVESEIADPSDTSDDERISEGKKIAEKGSSSAKDQLPSDTDANTVHYNYTNGDDSEEKVEIIDGDDVVNDDKGEEFVSDVNKEKSKVKAISTVEAGSKGKGGEEIEESEKEDSEFHIGNSDSEKEAKSKGEPKKEAQTNATGGEEQVTIESSDAENSGAKDGKSKSKEDDKKNENKGFKNEAEEKDSKTEDSKMDPKIEKDAIKSDSSDSSDSSNSKNESKESQSKNEEEKADSNEKGRKEERDESKSKSKGTEKENFNEKDSEKGESEKFITDKDSKAEGSKDDVERDEVKATHFDSKTSDESNENGSSLKANAGKVVEETKNGNDASSSEVEKPPLLSINVEQSEPVDMEEVAKDALVPGSEKKKETANGTESEGNEAAKDQKEDADAKAVDGSQQYKDRPSEDGREGKGYSDASDDAKSKSDETDFKRIDLNETKTNDVKQNGEALTGDSASNRNEKVDAKVETRGNAPKDPYADIGSSDGGEGYVKKFSNKSGHEDKDMLLEGKHEHAESKESRKISTEHLGKEEAIQDSKVSNRPTSILQNFHNAGAGFDADFFMGSKVGHDSKIEDAGAGGRTATGVVSLDFAGSGSVKDGRQEGKHQEVSGNDNRALNRASGGESTTEAKQEKQDENKDKSVKQEEAELVTSTDKTENAGKSENKEKGEELEKPMEEEKVESMEKAEETGKGGNQGKGEEPEKPMKQEKSEETKSMDKAEETDKVGNQDKGEEQENVEETKSKEESDTNYGEGKTTKQSAVESQNEEATKGNFPNVAAENEESYVKPTPQVTLNDFQPGRQAASNTGYKDSSSSKPTSPLSLSEFQTDAKRPDEVLFQENFEDSGKEEELESDSKGDKNAKDRNINLDNVQENNTSGKAAQSNVSGKMASNEGQNATKEEGGLPGGKVTMENKAVVNDSKVAANGSTVSGLKDENKEKADAKEVSKSHSKSDGSSSKHVKNSAEKQEQKVSRLSNGSGKEPKGAGEAEVAYKDIASGNPDEAKNESEGAFQGEEDGFNPVNVFTDVDSNGDLVEVEKDDPDGSIMTMTVDEEGKGGNEDGYKEDEGQEADAKHLLGQGDESKESEGSEGDSARPGNSTFADDVDDNQDIDAEKEALETFNNEHAENEEMSLDSLARILDDLDRSVDSMRVKNGTVRHKINEKEPTKNETDKAEARKKAANETQKGGRLSDNGEGKNSEGKESKNEEARKFANDESKGLKHVDETTQRKLEKTKKLKRPLHSKFVSKSAAIKGVGRKVAPRKSNHDQIKQSTDDVNRITGENEASDVINDADDGSQEDQAVEVVEPNNVLLFTKDADSRSGDWFEKVVKPARNKKVAKANRHRGKRPSLARWKENYGDYANDNEDEALLGRYADDGGIGGHIEDDFQKDAYPEEDRKKAKDNFVSQVSGIDGSMSGDQIKEINSALAKDDDVQFDPGSKHLDQNMFDLPDEKEDVMNQVKTSSKNTMDKIAAVFRAESSLEDQNSFPDDVVNTKFFSRETPALDFDQDVKGVEGMPSDGVGTPLRSLDPLYVNVNLNKKLTFETVDETNANLKHAIPLSGEKVQAKAAKPSEEGTNLNGPNSKFDDGGEFLNPEPLVLNTESGNARQLVNARKKPVNVKASVDKRAKKLGPRSKPLSKLVQNGKKKQKPSKAMAKGKVPKKGSKKAKPVLGKALAQKKGKDKLSSSAGLKKSGSKLAKLVKQVLKPKSSQPVSKVKQMQKLNDSLTLIDDMENQIDKELQKNGNPVVNDDDTISAEAAKISKLVSNTAGSESLGEKASARPILNASPTEQITLKSLLPEYGTDSAGLKATPVDETHDIEKQPQFPSPQEVEYKQSSEVLKDMNFKDRYARLKQAKALLQMQKYEADNAVDSVKNIQSKSMNEILKASMDRQSAFVKKIADKYEKDYYTPTPPSEESSLAGDSSETIDDTDTGAEEERAARLLKIDPDDPLPGSDTEPDQEDKDEDDGHSIIVQKNGIAEAGDDVSPVAETDDVDGTEEGDLPEKELEEEDDGRIREMTENTENEEEGENEDSSDDENNPDEDVDGDDDEDY